MQEQEAGFAITMVGLSAHRQCLPTAVAWIQRVVKISLRQGIDNVIAVMDLQLNPVLDKFMVLRT